LGKGDIKQTNMVCWVSRLIGSYISGAIFFLSLSLMILRGVFLSPYPVAFHDLAPIWRFEQLYRPYDYPWDHKSNLGTPSFLTGNAVYNALLIGFTVLVGSAVLAHKLVLISLMALSGFGFFLVIRYILGNTVAALTAGLYSMLNPFVWSRWVLGHNTIIFAYATFPLVLLEFFKSFRDRGIGHPILCGLLLGVVALLSPHMVYIFAIFALSYAVFELVTRSVKRSFNDVLRSILTPIALMIAASSVPVFPIIYLLITVRPQVYAIRAEEAVFFDTPSEVMSKFAGDILLGVIVSAAALMPSSVWLRLRGSLVNVPPLRGHRKWLSVFFSIVGLLGLLLAALPYRPLTPIYVWLFHNVPGFFMFREANKFILLTTISLAYFSGLLASRLHRCLSIKMKGFLAVLISFLVMAALIAYPSLGFFTGDLGGRVGTVAVPEKYDELYSWLLSSHEDFRIAFIPPAVWATSYNWAPIWFLDPLVALQAKPTLEIKSEQDLTSGADFTRWLYTTLYSGRSNDWGRMLGLTGSRYVIIRPDADMLGHREDLKLFSRSSDKFLGNKSGLIQSRKFGDLIVYENPYALPHIWVAERFGLAIGDRRLLTSLSALGYDFKQWPLSFPNKESPLQLDIIPAILILQGETLWDIVSIWPGAASIFYAGDHAAISTNPRGQWINGRLAWFASASELNAYPDPFAYTESTAPLVVPLQGIDSGDYLILIQTYDGLDGAASLIVQLPDKTITLDPSGQAGGRFRWRDLGVHHLSGPTTMKIMSLGGPAAVGKIMLVRPESVGEALAKILNWLSSMDVMIILEDFDWAPATNSIILPQTGASNGAILNPASIWAETHFTIWRPGPYHLIVRVFPMDNTFNITLHLDGVEYTVSGITNSTRPSLQHISEVYLTAGTHVMKARSDGRGSIDLVVLTTLPNIPTASETYAGGSVTLYQQLSGSEYRIYGGQEYLVFLEAASTSWRLFTEDGVEMPHQDAFSFGAIYRLTPNSSSYRLVYTGYQLLTYVLPYWFLMAPASLTVSILLLRRMSRKVPRRKKPTSNTYEH
jgi:hypothetical protein